MGYDPQTNKLNPLINEEAISYFKKEKPQFLFSIGEQVTLKGVVFEIHDIGDTRIVLKPVKAI